MRELVKGLFAGSFDPYTLGHHAIVKKAAGLFDELHILIGVNALKQRLYPAPEMADAIRRALAEDGLDNVTVVFYEGVVADYCAQHDIRYLVRGLRNSMDYNYEENIAMVNKLLNPELESIYMRADSAAISSSMVREMLGYDKDVSAYLPQAVLEMVQRGQAPKKQR